MASASESNPQHSAHPKGNGNPQGPGSLPSSSDPIHDLPSRYSFFQLVRQLLIEDRKDRGASPIGGARRANEEPIRFRTRPSLQFPTSDIHAVSRPAPDTEASTRQAVDIEVNFWGLYGVGGAMPTHYTQTVIDRLHAKDDTLRDFLDLFSHRQLSMFYRAWEKTFPVSGVERAQRSLREVDDTLRELLLCLVGFGNEKSRNRFGYLDETLVFYGGHLRQRPTVVGLQSMLQDFTQLPLRVLPLFGQWLRLPESEQSRLPDATSDLALSHCRLGTDLVLGERVWNAASKFRIRIGPVGIDNFDRYSPAGNGLRPLCQLTRAQVGLCIDFDVQVLLRAEDVPELRFPNDCETQSAGSMHESESEKGKSDFVPRLGWNTWLLSRPATRDSDDAVFHDDGSPDRAQGDARGLRVH